MCAERAVLVWQATVSDAITAVLALMEDVMTSFVIPEDHNEVKSAYYRLKAILQRLVSKTLVEKENSVKFKERLLLKKT